MSPHLARATLLAACAAAPLAEAGVQVSLVSYLSARPEIRDGRALTSAPLMELISLDAWDLQAPFVDSARVHLSGWGRLGLDRLAGPRPAAGDLDLAFVEGRMLGRQLRLVAGRQLVVGGAARLLQLDGLLAEYTAARRWRVSAWGGAPVAARFDVRRGDAAAGGRVAWAPSWDSELGASYALVLERGLVSRHDVGVDGRWAPSLSLWVAGHALFSLAETRLAEGELGPRWQVSSAVQLSLTARRVAPDLLLPRGSILSVFAEPARDELGGGAVWEVNPGLSLSGEAHAALLEGTLGGEVAAASAARLSRATLLVGELRWLRAPDEGFVRGRVGARHRLFPRLSLTADADVFRRERPVNGVRYSAVASATASWAFAPEWLASVELGAGSTPELAYLVRAMAKVSYRFQVADGDRRTAEEGLP